MLHIMTNVKPYKNQKHANNLGKKCHILNKRVKIRDVSCLIVSVGLENFALKARVIIFNNVSCNMIFGVCPTAQWVRTRLDLLATRYLLIQ